MIASKTISIVLPDLRSGGAERVNIDLAQMFQQRGYSVDFVLRHVRGELLDQAREIGNVVDLNAPRVRHAFKPLTEYINERRPDALLASMWPLTAVAARARDRSGHTCSLVLCEHGILSQQYADYGRIHGLVLRHSLRYASKRADHVVGVSNGVAWDLSQLSGREAENFKTIYNPVQVPQDVPQPQLEAAEALWSVPKGRRIITVGRLKEVKNHRMLIEAFAQVPEQDAELMLVGDGELMADLKNHARELGVAKRVIFASFQADPTPFYQSADVFALSSSREGFGNVLVEAMNNGLKVVATDCPTGPREILDGETYGLLTPVGDVGELSRTISKALTAAANPDQQRKRALEFRPEIAADAYLKLLFGD